MEAKVQGTRKGRKVREREGRGEGKTGRRDGGAGFRGGEKPQEAKKKTAPHVLSRTAGRKDTNIRKNGGDLLSHGYAVPSARTGLTALFGMGRGGTPAL